MSKKSRRNRGNQGAVSTAAPVAESFRVDGQEFVNRRDYIPFGWGQENYGFLPGVGDPGPYATSPDDRKHGRDEPYYQSDLDVANARSLARYITLVNGPAVGIGENLKNYVVGEGFSFSAGTKDKQNTPKGLVDAVQDVIDEFLDENDFVGDLDRELFWRSKRDGEFFLALYPKKSGLTIARVVEPEQVVDPGAPPWDDQLLNRLYRMNINVATNWEFGIHKADHDVLTIYGYHVMWSIGDNTYMPRRVMEHSKENVDRNVSRGLTDFYPVWKWLQQQARLLTNVGEGAAELAAISYIVQHIEGVTSDQAMTMRRAQADMSYTVNTPTGGTKTIYKEWRPPGTKLDVPAGQQYLPGPSGHEKGQAFLQVVQGILRQVATRFCMSEGMISGDDSNNTMASSIVAGSRFHKYAISQQSKFKSSCSRIIWKVLKNAFDSGCFLRFGFGPGQKTFAQFERLIEVLIEPPDVDEKKALEQVQERQILNASGILSRKTWAEQQGIDYELEQENITQEPPPPAAPGQPQGGPGGAPGMPPGLKLPQLPQPQSPSIQPPKPKTGKSEYDQMADDADESASSIKLMESSSPVKESVGVSPLAFPGGNFAMRELAAALNTSSVMAKLKPPLADVIRDLVLNLPSADVLRPELEPHVTIAASLLTDDVDSVVSFVRDEGPFLVTIGELSVFPADGDRQSDVLKLDVSSDVLNSLHLRLKTAIRNLQTYPTYKPHITLAYMRPGTASKYAGRCALTGQRFYVSDVVFSDSNKQHTIISLTGVLAAEAQAKTQRLCEVLETATCLTDALEFYP